ncbi:hypothetical protein SADUNF_Sadunf09G0106100 [Salix dunnii]|uniref:Uncharacterized protein n=1 Tax=Salix dunnii TaxID=1413687 RepID=A0A835MTK3_9ROSI|nr:hypothetical protein SADUNF_Sadunf09G0106100 [Salix dunnii]
MGALEKSRGRILAVASSAFTGSSFILKKKGLKRAGANGTRPGSYELKMFVITCLLRDWPGQNVSSIASELCGLTIILSGTNTNFILRWQMILELRFAI